MGLQTGLLSEQNTVSLLVSVSRASEIFNTSPCRLAQTALRVWGTSWRYSRKKAAELLGCWIPFQFNIDDLVLKIGLA